MEKIPLEDRDYMSVKEFADATGRFPNQIYELINHGNSFGKLKTKLVNNKTKVLKSEIEDFTFNNADKVRKETTDKIATVERKVAALEYLVENLTKKIKS